jgi:hypothetical protein
LEFINASGVHQCKWSSSMQVEFINASGVFLCNWTQLLEFFYASGVVQLDSDGCTSCPATEK